MAWTAALAVLLGALAPTVSRWLHASSAMPVALLEVCVTQPGGPSTIVLKSLDFVPNIAFAPASSASDDAPSSPGGNAHLDHCPFCLMQGEGGHGMAPPVATAALPLLPLREQVPALFLQAPRPLHTWAPSLARAPPSLFA